MALPNLTAKIGKAQIKIAQELVKEIATRTPVDTGTAKANWITDCTGTEQGYNVLHMDAQNAEKRSIARAQSLKLDEVIKGGTVYVYSNVPYIQALENGHSKQAPAGMVRNSIDKVTQ